MVRREFLTIPKKSAARSITSRGSSSLYLRRSEYRGRRRASRPAFNNGQPKTRAVFRHVRVRTALREWFDNRRQLPRRNAVSIFLDLEGRFALLVRGRQTNATFLLRKLTAFKTKFSTICLSASSSARIGVRHVGTLSCRSIPPSRAGYENCPVHASSKAPR